MFGFLEKSSCRVHGKRFIPGVCVLCSTYSWSDNKTNDVLQASLGVGFSFAALSYAFGRTSGGHLNPILTVAVVSSGRMSLFQGIIYVCAQTLGAIIGSAITFACMPLGSSHKHRGISTTLLHQDLSPPQGFALEMLFTLMFVFIFLVASHPETQPGVRAFGSHLGVRAFGVGVALTACHLCLAPFTGCGMNPVRSLGPAIVVGEWTHHWVYWLGPLSGGVVASVFHNFIFFMSEDVGGRSGLRDEETEGFGGSSKRRRSRRRRQRQRHVEV